MLEFDVGVFAGQAGGGGAPEPRGLQHVGLVHGSQLAAAAAGQLEPDAQDALDFRFGVAHGIDADDALGGFGAPFGLGVIQAAGELADDHHVHALKDVGLEHAGVGELGIDLDGADVGEDVEVSAQGQQSILGPGGGRWIVPFGSAHRAEQDRVGRRRQIADAVGQRSAVLVDGYAADVAVLEDEIMPKGATHGLHGLDALGGYLGSDTVATQNGDVEIHLPTAPIASASPSAGVDSGRPRGGG